MQIKKEPNEQLSDYIKRVCEYKKEHWKECSWEDVAECIKNEANFEKSEKWYRTERYLAMGVDADNIDKLTLLKMQKVAISDERTQVNAYYRSLSREQTFKDIASDWVEKLRFSKPLLTTREDLAEDTDKEAILQISDWHYGYDIHNAWNEYDPDICKRRVSELIEKVVSRCRTQNIRTLHVVNLGDLAAGRIHMQIRVQSREDLIGQTMYASEILAEALSELSRYFNVEYYDCTDNHSRVEPNKKESLQTETMTRIIHWYIKTRFDGNDRIHVNDNEFGDDIITFECNGHSVIGVHGDKDGATNVVDRLSGLTGRRYDLCLTAHRHHFFGDEKNYTVLLSNSSLCGADDFSIDHRLTATPAQNLIIATKENITDGIHRIILK